VGSKWIGLYESHVWSSGWECSLSETNFRKNFQLCLVGQACYPQSERKKFLKIKQMNLNF